MILPYWPEPVVPDYKVGRFGQWRADRTPTLKNMPGYFVPAATQPPGWRFLRDKTVWMSLTRMEIESHMPHIAAARGHTVIAGLGMGFMLFNVMQKENVTKVTVLERDPEVVKLMDRVTNWRHWPGHEKVNLVMCDATRYVPDEPVDFLYADIWEHVGSDDALPLTRAIQANVQASLVGFWTQEFDFISWCQNHKIRHDDANMTAYRQFARGVELPLIEQYSRIYPRLALLAVLIQTAATRTLEVNKRRLVQAAAFTLMMEDDPIDAALYKVK